MSAPRLLILGQVLVDVTLPPQRSAQEPKLRLGGVIHALRACWALGVPYGLGFVAPTYLHNAIRKYAASFGAEVADCIGTVDGSPNVILVNDARECGAQGYEQLLRDELTVDVDSASLSALLTKGWTDVLAFPSNQDAGPILHALQSLHGPRCHVETGWLSGELGLLTESGFKSDTVFISTSSSIFLEGCEGQAARLAQMVVGHVSANMVLKENRGGARLFTEGGPIIHVPAHVTPIVHSVGVGDVFDVAYVATHATRGGEGAMRLAALIASAYAMTTEPDVFGRDVGAWIREDPAVVGELAGVILPWESRPQANIYIAAPDFDYMDVRPVDDVVAMLRYHNFCPRRPVREFGQLKVDDPPHRRHALLSADLELLAGCSLMVAVLLSDDPGTLIEVGLAVQRGMPVVVYDPYSRASNLFLQELPELVSSDLDEIVGRVFTVAARVLRR